MKKRLMLVLVFILMILPMNSYASELVQVGDEYIDISGQRDITIVVNGNVVEPDSRSFIYNGRTFLPIRFIAEELGFEVAWRPTGLVYDDEIEVLLTSPIGRTIYINIVLVRSSDGIIYSSGNPTKDPGYILKDDRTFLPVRYIANALHMDVDWDPNTYTVTLTTNNNNEIYPLYFRDYSQNSYEPKIVKAPFDIEWRDGEYKIQGTVFTLQDKINEMYSRNWSDSLVYDDISKIMNYYENSDYMMSPDKEKIIGIIGG